MLESQNIVPLYQQVEDEIYRRIQSGVYTSAEKLPTELELAKQFQVSTITVKKAILNLVEQGLLCRKQGKGTFVVSHKQTRELREVIGFSQTCQLNGTVPGSKTLEQALVPAPMIVKEALQSQEDRVVFISRLRYADGAPMAIESNWFPLEFSFLLNENLENKSLFERLQQMNVTLFSARRTIEICYANHEENHLLEVPLKTALLLVKSTAYSPGGKPVFYGKQIINADHFQLIV